MVTREQQTAALRAVASAVVSAVAESPSGIGEGPLCVILMVEAKGMKWEHARTLINVLCEYGILMREAGHRIIAGPNAAAML